MSLRGHGRREFGSQSRQPCGQGGSVGIGVGSDVIGGVGEGIGGRAPGVGDGEGRGWKFGELEAGAPGASERVTP